MNVASHLPNSILECDWEEMFNKLIQSSILILLVRTPHSPNQVELATSPANSMVGATTFIC